jgi:hypothetical protein
MAHPDLDQLMNAMMSFAQQTLSKRGAFCPFGATIKTSGEIAMAAASDGDEAPPSQQVSQILTDSLRAQASASEIKAAGVCVDVRVCRPGESVKTDAIHCGLEHATGESVDVYLPYRKRWFGRVEYDEIFASRRAPQIFVKS